jgi:hypothetical protein
VVETEGVRLFLDARMDVQGSVGFIINTPSCEKHAE